MNSKLNTVLLALVAVLLAANLGYTVYQGQQVAQAIDEDRAYREELAGNIRDFNTDLVDQMDNIVNEYEQVAYGGSLDRIAEQQLVATEYQLRLMQLLIQQQGELAYMLSGTP
jgi:uncharacterized protein HemX